MESYAQPAAEMIGGRYIVRRLMNEANGVRTLLGDDRSTGDQVVIKAASVSTLAPDALVRLGHEAAVLSRLESEHVTPLLDWGREGGLLYLVLPFVAGTTLEERLRKGPLSVRDTVAVARSVFSALRDAHEQGILHRDVKPSNIILRLEAVIDRAELIDFGLARSRSLDRSVRDFPAGTVRYMSPEAAGVLEREVDVRSDLYSVGAVLYECLVGRPLFSGGSLGDVLRQHAAAEPVDPRAFGLQIPRAVAELVMRLLAKEPSERYQSAEGVLADLEDIAGSLERGEAEPAVVVGLHDNRRALADPAFVGRDAELAMLDRELERARSGDGGLFGLEAESGGGKTRLLDEFARESAGRSACILRGQGVDQAAQRPFQVLTGIAAGIVNEVRARPELRQTLRDRIGDRVESVCAAFPELRAVCEGAPDAPTIGPEAFGETRTLEALSALLTAMGSVDRPAVVLLDDCQWADELTLKLLAYWQRHTLEGGSTHTLIIAAFRSEEVGADHPLRRVEPSGTLELAPLQSRDVRQLAESMAGTLPAEALEVVVEVSDGSPFMAAAVVRGLVEAGALVEESGGWSVDVAAMADAKASRRAAAFLARRLKLLPDATLDLLSVAAITGKEFEPDFVSALAGRSASDGHRALEVARRRHIVWMRDGRWTFVHDKLREAVIALLSDDERRRLHVLAAHRLEETGSDREFDIAYHFDEAGQSERALPYALSAAQQARAQHALDIAQQQYEISERGAANADAETSLSIAEGLGNVLMLRGHYDAAELKFQRARVLAEDRITRARVERSLGDLAFKRGDLEGAREALERGLRTLERRVPKRSITLLIAALFEVVVQLLHTAFPRLFLARRSLRGAEAELAAIRLYSRLAHVYWFARGTIPTFWAHQREMNLAERYPHTPELAQAYSEHAPAMALIPYYSRGVRYGLRSLAIRRALGDLWGEGQSLHFLGIVAYSASRFEECVDRCREAVRLLGRMGDRWEVNTAEQHIALSLYRLGDLAGAVDVASRVYRNGVEIGDAQARCISLDAWSKASKGRVHRDLIHAELELQTYNVQAKAEVLQAEAVRLISEDAPIEAATVLEHAHRLVRQAGLRQEYVAPIAPWLATALRMQGESLPLRDPKTYRRLVRRGRRAAWKARLLAFSYRNNQAHALRESGLLAAMSGRPRRARRYLERSAAAAARYGMRYEAAQTLVAQARLAEEFGWLRPEVELADAESMLRTLETGPTQAEPVTPSLIDRFDTVLDVGRKITSALQPEAIYEATREAAIALLRGERSVVLEVPAQDADLKPVAGHAHVEFSRTLARRALAEGRPVRLDDESVDASESVVLAGVRSALCAPIFVRGRAAACVYVEHRKLAGLFGSDEERLAAFVATIAGAALENAEGFAEIQDLTRTLEQRVLDRTKRLDDTNRRLDESLHRLTESYDREVEITGQLKRLDQLKTDFMAMAAHDLRTPITVIGGFTEMLRDQWPNLDESQKRMMVERITNNASRLSGFIDNLLQFARIESGEVSYDAQAFDLGALVEKTVAEQERPESSQPFEVFIDKGLPSALGDDRRTWQVISNLLSNAMKFSDDKPIEVRVWLQDDFLHMSVRDHGVGMSDESLARLFQKFGRIEQPDARRAGTGLGLYISKSIVEAQGGRIWASSVPGEGSTFTYTIPVAREAA